MSQAAPSNNLIHSSRTGSDARCSGLLLPLLLLSDLKSHFFLLYFFRQTLDSRFLFLFSLGLVGFFIFGADIGCLEPLGWCEQLSPNPD